jgi:hypothetical protein
MRYPEVPQNTTLHLQNCRRQCYGAFTDFPSLVKRAKAVARQWRGNAEKTAVALEDYSPFGWNLIIHLTGGCSREKRSAKFKVIAQAELSLPA